VPAARRRTSSVFCSVAERVVEFKVPMAWLFRTTVCGAV
jgi:hypothetical protein